MQAFEYASPSSVKEAVGMLSSNWGEVEVLAGGTDLISLMKDYLLTPKKVVNIKGIKELGGIAKHGGGVRIGAVATMDDLASSALVRTEFPALQQAALGIASPQIRNMGTVGGDLCQRNRCWYFRQGFGVLAKDKSGQSLVPNGENKYHAIFPQGDAYFVSASSLGPALIALGAKVKVAGPSGEREIPVEQLFVAPRDNSGREISLAANEIVTEVHVPGGKVRNSTYEVRQKDALDWPLAAAAVALTMKGNAVAKARIVLGHVGPTPVIAEEAARMLEGKTITADVAAEAGRAAVANAKPLSANGYKLQLTRVAVKRALMQAAGVRA